MVIKNEKEKKIAEFGKEFCKAIVEALNYQENKEEIDIDYSGTPHIAVYPYPERTLKYKGVTGPYQIDDYLKKNFDLLHKKGYGVGGWYDKKNGLTYLDVVVPILKKFSVDAEKLHNMSNQLSYDLENFKNMDDWTKRNSIDKGINITPILEHVLGVSEINSAEDLQMLIDALEEMPEDSKVNAQNMAEIMDRIKAKKDIEESKTDLFKFKANSNLKKPKVDYGQITTDALRRATKDDSDII